MSHFRTLIQKSQEFSNTTGITKHDNTFLDNFLSKVLEKKFIFEDTPMVYINERMSQGSYDMAYKHIDLLKERSIITEEKYQSLKEYIDSIRIKINAPL